MLAFAVSDFQKIKQSQPHKGLSASNSNILSSRHKDKINSTTIYIQIDITYTD